jgi:hypothetical protein
MEEPGHLHSMAAENAVDVKLVAAAGGEQPSPESEQVITELP